MRARRRAACRCIAGFVAAGLYLGIGVAVNRTRGQDGIHSIPNLGLWAELCRLAGEGCRFSFKGFKRAGGAAVVSTIGGRGRFAAYEDL